MDTNTKPNIIIHQPKRPGSHLRNYPQSRGYYNSSWWPWWGYRRRGRGPYNSTGNHGHDYLGEAPYRHTHEHGHPANDMDGDAYDGFWLCFVFWFVLILLFLFLPLIFWGGGYDHHGHHHASDDEFTNAVCEALPDCIAFQDLKARVALLEAAAAP